MLDISPRSTAQPVRLGLVSTYPPTRCGIGRFAASLVRSLAEIAPHVTTDIVRLVEHDRHGAGGGPAAMQIDPNSTVSIRAAARLLNRDDMVVIQHEYGIFGRDDGVAVLDLLDRVERPAVVVLHTVVPEPSDNQRRIIQGISRRADVVALCETARSTLIRTYGIRHRPVAVIPHGIHWTAQPPNQAPRQRIITWGLLGPGKGIERAIRSVALLRADGLDVRYLIVGRTHPEVARRHGLAYRHHLEGLVVELGVGDLVSFVDRYLDDDELLAMVRRSDLVVVPYDNVDQVSSGVVTDALGAGRPVVATRFPYAVEVLGTGAGLAVEHDHRALAAGIRTLLEDEQRYRAATEAAAGLSAERSWAKVARRYLDLVHELLPREATA